MRQTKTGYAVDIPETASALINEIGQYRHPEKGNKN